VARCQLALAYAIERIDPEMTSVDTFETETVDCDRLAEAVRDVFPWSVSGMTVALGLRRPIFRKTAAYGHLGRDDQGFELEHIDRAADLRAFFMR
jgi:S-adenosylmethionine synthetase